MTEITVETTSYTTPNRSWLIFEAEGRNAPVPRGTAEIDFSTFTSGTHYPDGYIKSGTVLGRVTATGRVGIYSDAAGDGRQTAVGHLYNDVKVPTGAPAASKVSVVYVRSFAAVSESRLPANHGLDTAGKTDLRLIDYQA